ncbi:MAG: hypothetical protein ACYTDW_09690 [Planctomycetota bacterium]|jgi:hypothetical protein
MEFDFGQNQKVESLDTVPEDFRGLYREVEGGGFQLGSNDAAIGAAIAVIPRLNGALKAARAEAKANKGQKVDLSPLAEYGEDVETIATGISTKFEELQKQVKGGEQVKADREKITEALGKKHAAELQKHQARAAALQAQLYKIMVDNEALKEIGDQATNPKLLLPFIREQVKPGEEEGEFVVRVVNGDGPRFSPTTGTHMTVNELVKEMKASEEYGVLFKSETPSGTGKVPGSSSRVVGGQPTTKSALDKIKAGLDARG